MLEHRTSSNFTLTSTSSKTGSSRLSSKKKSNKNTQIDLTKPQQNSKFPIKINMSRASIKKKQIEIMDEYNRFNTIELLNSLRKIQQDLDHKVKQFTQKNMQNENDQF